MGMGQRRRRGSGPLRGETMAKMLRGLNAGKSRAGNSKALALFLLALVLAGLAQWLVGQEDAPISLARQLPGWLLFVGGGILLHLSFRRSQDKAGSGTLPFALEAGLLALVLVLSIFLRLHDLRDYPSGCFRDEGENGNVAIQLLNGEVVGSTNQVCPVYIEDNTENAACYFYPLALSFKLFGISVISVRYVSVFCGVLSVLAFWALARWLFGPLMAIFLAACLAALRWHLDFSRIGFLGIMSVFLCLPMLWCLYRGLSAPAPARERENDTVLFVVALFLAVARGLLETWMSPGPLEAAGGLLLGLPLLYCAARSFKDERSRWLMLAAVAMAFAMYSYIAARLFLVLVPLLVGHHLLTRQRPLATRAWMALAACLGLLAAGGLILVFSSAHSVSNAAWRGSPPWYLGVAVMVLGSLGLALFWWRPRGLLKGWLRPLGLALGVGLVVAGPLCAYSGRFHTQVAARSYTVSIFNDESGDTSPWGQRLLANLGPTLGMVNVSGDTNGRHNLPYALMVNPLWAALFALGIFFALLNLGDPRAWLALCLWQVSLLAGYYSDCAPQASRCLCATPAVLIFMGLALEPGFAALKAGLKGRGGLAACLLLLPILAVGAGLELHTYFVTQRLDSDVWGSFSPDEYLMGKDLKALNTGGLHTRGLPRPDWANSFTFRFMTYPERNFEAFDPAVDVPMRQRPDLKGEDLLYILGDVYQPLVGVLRGFYPHGVYREVRHPYNGVLLYWTYWVSAAEAARASTVSTGLTGDYYQDGLPADPDHPEKSPHWVAKTKAFSRVDPEILFQW